jgi:hypothetical protein
MPSQAVCARCGRKVRIPAATPVPGFACKACRAGRRYNRKVLGFALAVLAVAGAGAAAVVGSLYLVRQIEKAGDGPAPAAVAAEKKAVDPREPARQFILNAFEKAYDEESRKGYNLPPLRKEEFKLEPDPVDPVKWAFSVPVGVGGLAEGTSLTGVSVKANVRFAGDPLPGFSVKKIDYAARIEILHERGAGFKVFVFDRKFTREL